MTFTTCTHTITSVYMHVCACMFVMYVYTVSVIHRQSCKSLKYRTMHITETERLTFHSDTGSVISHYKTYELLLNDSRMVSTLQILFVLLSEIMLSGGSAWEETLQIFDRALLHLKDPPLLANTYVVLLSQTHHNDSMMLHQFMEPIPPGTKICSGFDCLRA